MKLSDKLKGLTEEKPPEPPKKPPIASGTRLSDRMVAEFGELAEGKGSRKFAESFARGGVPMSPETERVFGLPRRERSETEISALTSSMNSHFQKPGATMALRPLQAVSLYEAAESNGLLAPMGVGSGKTLVTLLLPEVLDSKVAVLLVAPQLRNQLIQHDIGFYAKHFRFKWREDKAEMQLHVLAYSTLSIEAGAYELEKINPDLIIADECHNLRHNTATRTKRFLRYCKDHPGTRFCGLSGTMTTRSLRDYAHLSELALRKNSPLPDNYQVLQDWADAIDVVPGGFNQMQPGVLEQLCRPGESLRSGFRRRFTETQGVVATSETALGTSLVIEERGIELPMSIIDSLEEVKSTWMRPDGEELSDPLEYSRVLKQIASGFYYRWVWPDGIPDNEWLQARAAWHKEVRERLKRAQPGMDSPMLVARAAAHAVQCVDRKCVQKHFDSEHWLNWAAVKDRPEPPTEPVWISDFLAKDIAACMQTKTSLVFYEYEALGEKIAELAHTEVLGGGAAADIEFARLNEKPADRLPSVVASIKAHGHGKNLQAWSRMIFASCPSNGAVWEQALGRTHRPGQLADEVNVQIYLQTEEVQDAFYQALKDSRYIEETTGSKQKLNYATKICGKGEL